jgi:hypothetical protein
MILTGKRREEIIITKYNEQQHTDSCWNEVLLSLFFFHFCFKIMADLIVMVRLPTIIGCKVTPIQSDYQKKILPFNRYFIIVT